jgi:DNA-binding XRE family transcriptional regulator
MQPNESWLAAQRKKLGLSQAGIADRLGVTRQTINSWEKGRTNPGTWIINDVAELLGVTLERLRYHLPNGGRARKRGCQKKNVNW